MLSSPKGPRSASTHCTFTALDLGNKVPKRLPRTGQSAKTLEGPGVIESWCMSRMNMAEEAEKKESP